MSMGIYIIMSMGIYICSWVFNKCPWVFICSWVFITLYRSKCCKFYNNNLGGSVLSTCECCMILDSACGRLDSIMNAIIL